MLEFEYGSWPLLQADAFVSFLFCLHYYHVCAIKRIFLEQNTYHNMDMKIFGSKSHQYQLPLAEKTAISMPTRVPL